MIKKKMQMMGPYPLSLDEAQAWIQYQIFNEETLMNCLFTEESELKGPDKDGEAPGSR